MYSIRSRCRHSSTVELIQTVGLIKNRSPNSVILLFNTSTSVNDVKCIIMHKNQQNVTIQQNANHNIDSQAAPQLNRRYSQSLHLDNYVRAINIVSKISIIIQDIIVCALYDSMW